MARTPRRFARGITAEVAAYTGPSGEVIYNTTTKRLHTQDGATAGGTALATLTEVSSIASDVVALAATYGNCYLAKSGVNLILRAKDGGKLFIGGVNRDIPATSPALAATSLTPGTLYYIYAYMNAGVMTLEASATAYAIGAVAPYIGWPTKTGDTTRTLVGMARPITGPAWQDTAAQRFVRSWFNRRSVLCSAVFTANRVVSALSYTEAHAEIRNEFLTWGDESVSSAFTGAWQSASGAAMNYAGIAFDSPVITGGAIQSSTSLSGPAVIAARAELAEGYHYVTLVAKVSASTLTFTGGSDGSVLQTTLRG